MKKNSYILFSLLISIACSTPKSEKEYNTMQTDSVEKLPEEPVQVTNATQMLRSIMGIGEGLLRGVNFGYSIGEIKKIESAELFEEDASHLGYTFDTNNLETVDILYEKDAHQKLKGIQLDLFLNSEKSKKDIRIEFENLFDIRYGKAMKQDSLSSIWKIKPSGSVTIKDVSNAKDKGLQINFSQP